MESGADADAATRRVRGEQRRRRRRDDAETYERDVARAPQVRRTVSALYDDWLVPAARAVRWVSVNLYARVVLPTARALWTAATRTKDAALRAATATARAVHRAARWMASTLYGAVRWTATTLYDRCLVPAARAVRETYRRVLAPAGRATLDVLVWTAKRVVAPVLRLSVDAFTPIVAAGASAAFAREALAREAGVRSDSDSTLGAARAFASLAPFVCATVAYAGVALAALGKNLDASAEPSRRAAFRADAAAALAAEQRGAFRRPLSAFLSRAGKTLYYHQDLGLLDLAAYFLPRGCSADGSRRRRDGGAEVPRRRVAPPPPPPLRRGH